MILKYDRSVPAVPNDEKFITEPSQAFKREREAFNYLLGR